MDEATTKTTEDGVKISLAKLMKVKNRLAGRIATTQSEIVNYNSTVQGSESPDVKTLYDLYDKMTAQMVKLKVALFDANRGGQQERIFALAEKKSKLTWLRGMSTRNGPQQGYDDKVVNYVATFKKADVDSLARQLEREIDETQDAIDSFNASRKVTVDSELFTLVG
jgi:hypothetical protein